MGPPDEEGVVFGGTKLVLAGPVTKLSKIENNGSSQITVFTCGLKFVVFS